MAQLLGTNTRTTSCIYDLAAGVSYTLYGNMCHLKGAAVDRQHKIEQIEAIQDEVKGFHPLLNDILRRLGNVLYVEYTHGQDEMGADFVIERTDPSIMETYHVGVVAKTEKILQNFTALERQIDECDVKRFIWQGKQEIRLQEIWVITSQSVSENAKKKISDKYSNRKIHFFGADWLVDQIDLHSPYYWHQLPNATGTYLATLSRNIDELDAQTSLLHVPTASKKYIELDITAIETDSYRKKGSHKKARSVNLIDEIVHNKMTVLEAEMGFGKSKFARRVASHYASPGTLRETKLLPVFQPFTVFARSDYEDLEKRIALLIGNDCFAEAQSNGTKFLLILDGIDEANGDPVRCREVVAKLVSEIRRLDSVRLLLTTRPFKLLEDIPDANKTAQRYSIRPLSIAKLIRFITEVCEQTNIPKKLYQDLAKSELFKQLPQNPIAASLISNLITQDKQELPSNLTELYAKSVDFMLGRWDEQRGLSTEKLFRASERISRLLARYMIENQLIYISAGEAREMFERFLGDRQMGVSADEVNSYLMTRSNLFGILDDTGTIFFRHRSFAEYLYALDAYELRNLPINETAFHPYWVNVYYFYIGLLAECPDLLKEIVNLSSDNERTRWMRFLHLSNYLLAGYQTPYVVIEESVRGLIVEAAQLYLDVKSGRITTHLRQLSEMSLLWIFAMFAKHCWGYVFFQKALPLVMAQIDEDGSLEHDVKIYALFFAACALAEVEDGCGCQFLLKSYKTESLPLPVSLALECEINYPGLNLGKDPLIKRHAKLLRKLLSVDKDGKVGIQGKLADLYRKPLNSTLSKVIAAPKNS